MGCSFYNKQHKIKELNNEIKLEKFENQSLKLTKEKIIEDDLNELTKIYPQMKNEIKLEKRGLIINEIDKTIYYGEWDINKNIKHGRGIQFWQDGAIYIGYWQKGKACGKGKMFHAYGDIYEGDWINDKANGYGIYIQINGTIYLRRLER